MDKRILDVNSVLYRLRIAYAMVWVLALGLIVLYEAGILEEGALAHDGRTCYLLQTASVLLTLFLIPASLKLFSLILPKLPSEEVARKKAYLRWNEVRLAMLAVVIWVSLSVYYVTLTSLGGLCAFIGLLATLFCLPSEARVKNELFAEEEDETDCNHC